MHRFGDVERERYAMLTGICKHDTFNICDFECLDIAEHIKSPLWYIPVV